jgi:hypothetical protein
MYEVSPERGYESPGPALAPLSAAALSGEPEVLGPALGHDRAELGVHFSVLSLADTVPSRMN